MKFTDFRMSWRLLMQQPMYSVIMIFSLAIGFAICFLVLAFTRYEYGFDTNVPEVQDVYVLKARANWGFGFWSENVPLSMKESIEKSGIPVLSTAVLPYSTSVRVGDVTSKMTLTLVDPAFSTIFGIQAVEGDLQAAISRPDAVALTDETAKKLFGDVHVTGRNVQIQGNTYRIAAVLPKQSITSTLQFEALAGLNSSAWPESARQLAKDNWNYYDDKNFVNCKVYVRLLSGSKLNALLQMIGNDVENSALRGHLNSKENLQLAKGTLLDIAFGPLAGSYLDSDARSNSGEKGDPIGIYAMNAVALLILLLTAANYVNLATIRTIARQREMAIRKVLGVTATRLLGQLMTESILVSLLAAFLGALLAWLLLPAWSDLTEHNFTSILTQRDWIIFGGIVLAMGVVVGVLAGIYPAWIALKMRPNVALGGRGNSETAGGLWLRRILTVLQFAIALFVSGMIVTLASQIQYLKKIDYGYQLDSLLTISIPAEIKQADVRSFRDALERLPQINGVAGTTPSPVKTEFKTNKTEVVSLRTLPVSPTYFSTFGINVAAGRAFDPAKDSSDNPDVIVMNAVAARQLGFPNANDAVGQIVSMRGKPMQIVGISNTVSNGFFHGEQREIVYEIAGNIPQLTVNAGKDVSAAKTAITSLWHQYFPDHYLNLNSLRTQLEMNAGGPQAILDTCVIVAAIIIPLAIFSIYILSAYTVQRRSREIVLRKLHGAERSDIALLLLREFFILLGIAALLGLPMSYIAGRMFVEQFADQAPMGVMAIGYAFLGAVIVSVFAIARHILIAVRMSPAAALRAV